MPLNITGDGGPNIPKDGGHFKINIMPAEEHQNIGNPRNNIELPTERPSPHVKRDMSPLVARRGWHITGHGGPSIRAEEHNLIVNGGPIIQKRPAH
jgi:hypothetical protein